MWWRYDYVFADPKPPVDFGPGMMNFRMFVKSEIFRERPWQITLPETCSYSRWVKEGVCSLEYTGFGELFAVCSSVLDPVDSVFRLTWQSAAMLKAVVVLTLFLLSNFSVLVLVNTISNRIGWRLACPAVFDTVTCSTDSDCARGLTCRPLNYAPMFSVYKFDPLFIASILMPRINELSYNLTKDLPSTHITKKELTKIRCRIRILPKGCCVHA